MLFYNLDHLAFQIWVVSHLYRIGVASAQVTGWGEGSRDPKGGKSRLWGNSFGVPGFNQSYDYVIVGGGTAGNTLAARLAEDPRGFSVAVIEAGGFYEFENGNLTEIPGYNGWSTHIDNTRPSLVEWDIETLPQPGYNGRTLHYSQGRTLGGTSAINSLGYHRGTTGFHELWADAVGDQSWSWENVLPYYKRSCKFTPANLDKIGHEFDIPFDGDAFSPEGGPLEISYGDYRGVYVNPVADGLRRLGLKRLHGLNSGELLGYGAITLTIDPETLVRSSSETSFLQSAMAKTSVKVYDSTLAKKILFDEKKRVTGVLVAAKGQVDYEFVLSAKREVIISAGVFHSPQLLMVSGIGPKQTLQRFGIPVLSGLEGVGQNLWDQPYYRLTYKVNVTTLTQMENPEYYAAATDAYLKDHSGPLTTNNAGEVIGWEKLPEPYRSRLSALTLNHLSTFPADFPEIELLPFGIGPRPETAVLSPENNWMTFAAGILTPRSRGNVTIRSTDTNDQPLVSPNFLEDPADEELAIQAVLRVREWAAATGIVVLEEDPGVAVQSEAEVKRWLREAGALVFHGSSTCAMGKPDDPLAVLDSAARVYGVSGLRVVDASSSPLLGPGHPMATVYMIAEKIADSILADAALASDTKIKPATAGSRLEVVPEHSEL